MKINLLLLDKTPIEKQLEIEEGLLRTGHENWMIINTGSSPAIVMGLSSAPHDWIDVERAQKDGIPIIQRFSGGGTVFVDHNTLFTSFIMNRDALDIEPFPRPILNWTTKFYKEALQIDAIKLVENDYVIGNKKFAGNAQYLSRNRWLHHSTHLYDFDPKNMKYLLHPKRQPKYRQERKHTDFLTTLKPHLSKDHFCTKVIEHLRNHFEVTEASKPTSFPDHRKTTKLV